MREWLKDLSGAERRVIGEDISRVEFRWPKVGLPLVRSLGRDLWEVRSSLPNGTISRVIFCPYENQMFLLHGFIKKTQKTPAREIDLALKRLKESQQ